ncbi:MAG: peptide ABC transporter substrate-binding protein [Spirochaetales bacterium]|nr:peptide ABC transporter substrate-binding protein [Spirochaetales bacterium]
MPRKIPLLLLVLFSAAAGFAESRPLVVIISKNGVGFDPHHSITMQEAQVYTAFYEGLLTFDPANLGVKPGIAEKWEITRDKKNYTFKLNKNARFDNGDKITASTVRDSWLRLLDPAQHADYSVLLDPVKGAREYREGKLLNAEDVGIQVKDDYTLQVILSEPAAHFLKVLSHNSLVPINSKNLDGPAWSAGPAVIGNGPFKVKRIDEKKIILEKNEYYWDAENVNLDGIEFILSDDADRNTSLFNYGKADWILSGIEFENLINQDHIQVNPEFAISLFFFSVKSGPFADPRVRSGLTHLLKWEKIRSLDRFNYPVDYIVPALQGYPQRTGIREQNVSKGLSLLAEAGYPEGKGLPPLVFCLGKSDIDAETAGIMKESWEEFLDIKVEIKQYEWHEYYDALDRDDYTLGTLTWIGDYGDPLTFLQLWEGNSNLNNTGYNDETYNTLIHESMSLDGLARYRKLVEAEQILLEDALVLPINQPYAVNLINIDTIKGWYPNLLDIHPFKYIEISNPSLPSNTVMAW